jgi:phage replication-related protein YjqB (UPF0714/DUF867 family)
MTDPVSSSGEDHVDRYTCFADLTKNEKSEVGYTIEVERRDRPIAIIAPHGGCIELHTTEIAKAIAGARYNFYSFTGTKKFECFDALHITSTNFDEPQCRGLIGNCEVVVAIHGRKDRNDPETILVGGRDTASRLAIANHLSAARFVVRPATGRLAGTEPDNICNRGRTKAGVQLELPLTLRKALHKDTAEMSRFAAAINAAIDGR